MDAPPVQYTRTRDGYSIAYMVSGQGPALIVLPQMFQHSQRLWAGPFGRSLKFLTGHFRVIQYDSRGQGLSQRGIKTIALEDYVTDLEAVVDRVSADPVALTATAHFGHVALRYAAKNPGKVAGVVLLNTNIGRVLNGNVVPLHSDGFLEMGETNWDGFLRICARAMFPRANAAAVIDYFQAAGSPDDQLKLMRVIALSSGEEVALRVTAPVLMVAQSVDPYISGPADFGRLLAPILPNGHLVIRENPLASSGDASEFDLLSVSFLDDIGYGLATGVAAPDGLTAREMEVLRLIAAGKSNPQIAGELVISLNTVQRHVSNVFDKTGVANRAQAAVYAKDHGLA
jgi:DNA-binding CsgD family transcriptional regulator/pimeloyl-ACP methyl ester carboxylesterase